MPAININNLTIPSLQNSKNTRITSDLLETTIDPKGQKAEENHIIKKISDLFLDFLLNRYDPKYSNAIRENWDAILNQAISNAGVSKSDLLVCSCAKRVLKSLEDVIYHIELDGFDPFEGKTDVDKNPVRNFLGYLLNSISFNHRLLSFDNLKAIFWRKDPILFKQLREELKDILKSINTKFSNSFFSSLMPDLKMPFFGKKSFSNDFLVDSLVEQILCLYSYVEPEQGEIIEVPIRKNGLLRTYNFEVEKIMLVPKWLGGPIEAYALTPQKKGLSPILIFRGTPPNPTADGSFFASLTDYTPGFSVGETLYKVGRKKLHEWMAKTKSRYPNEKVTVLGHSLGGSLTYHFANDFPASSIVGAYDSAGLFPRGLSTKTELIPKFLHRLLPKSLSSKIEDAKKPKGKIILHPIDMVSTLGSHPESLETIKVITKGMNFYSAHFKLYGFGKKSTIYLKVDPTVENMRLARKVMNLFHIVYSIPFFFYKVLYLAFMILINKALTSIKRPILRNTKSTFIKS